MHLYLAFSFYISIEIRGFKDQVNERVKILFVRQEFLFHFILSLPKIVTIVENFRKFNID